MAQEVATRKKELSYIEYIQLQHKTAVSLMEGQLKWNTQKQKYIIEMKDRFLEMAKKGFYDKPKSEICADICEILKQHNGDENSFAYVRMCLESEYKDQTKVTFDSIIKRAFKQNKDEIDKDKINLLAPLKKEDFDGLTPTEIMLYRNEYVDIIKESKRRIRDNKILVNTIVQDIKINTALVTDKKFPNMNTKVRMILLELRDVIKSTKKINRLINLEADKTTENKNYDYNDELNAMLEQTKRLSGMALQLISLLN